MSSPQRKLSPEEMDRQLESAVESLKSLIPSETMQVVADWWNQWYRFTGHRRLGRALKDQAQSQSQRTKKSDFNPQTTTSSTFRAHTLTNGINYTFVEQELDSPAMFTVDTVGGEIRIALNTSHPAHSYLSILMRSSDHEKEEDNTRPANHLAQGIGILLESWAKYEEEQPKGTLRVRAQNARMDWGRVARERLSILERESE